MRDGDISHIVNLPRTHFSILLRFRTTHAFVSPHDLLQIFLTLLLNLSNIHLLQLIILTLFLHTFPFGLQESQNFQLIKTWVQCNDNVSLFLQESIKARLLESLMLQRLSALRLIFLLQLSLQRCKLELLVRLNELCRHSLDLANGVGLKL